MSARIEAAAKVICDKLGYVPNFPAMTALVPVAAAALAAADRVSLAGTEELTKRLARLALLEYAAAITHNDWTELLLAAKQAAAALAGLAGENARLRRIAEAAQRLHSYYNISNWMSGEFDELRAALQEPPHAT